MALTAQQAAEKWARNLGASTQAMTDGVNGVTDSPTAKAAQAVDRQVAGVQRAAASGKTAQALNAVTLQSWKDSMTKKGIPRVAAGATQAQPKVANFMSQLIPYVQQGKQMLQNQPRGDINANRARMLAWMDYMSNFAYRK